jgi:Flp pilus assembly protein TadD
VRIVILGASAARGTPAAEYSVGRVLRVMLQERYPGVEFEVINTGVAAINSHAVRDIADDCARLGTDIFIVYLGNNEVVGPFGPGSVFRTHTPSLAAIRIGLWLRSTRIGQLLSGWIQAVVGSNEPTEWSGMAMFMEKSVPAHDERLNAVYSHFRQNLRAICRSAQRCDARTILSTVPANLKDSPPFASQHRPGLQPEELGRWQAAFEMGRTAEDSSRYDVAVKHYAEAARIDDRFAELQFRLGRCQLALGESAVAREHFARARDLDVLRFRADSRINRAVREVASEMSGQGVFLLDAAQRFAARDPEGQGLPGSKFFYEHVHLNFRGNYVLASELLQMVDSLLPPDVRARATAAFPTALRCAQLLALTDVELFRFERDVFQIMEGAPFTGQPEYEKDRARRMSRLQAFLARANSPSAANESVAQLGAAVQRDPEDLFFRIKYAESLAHVGRIDESVQQHAILMGRLPGVASWHLALGKVLEFAGQPFRAEIELRRAIQLAPRSETALVARLRLSTILAERGQHDEAVSLVHRAVQFSRASWNAHHALATALLRSGDEEGAERHWRRTIVLHPGFAAARRSLASLLIRQQREAEGLEQLRRVVRLEPQDADSRNALGQMLLRRGDVGEAVAQFQRALESSPDSEKARENLEMASSRQQAVVEQNRAALADARSRGDTAAALHAVRELARAAPDSVELISSVAWRLATSSDPELRDGTDAVRLAEHAAQLSRYVSPDALRALAGAYAETGRFDDAVRVAAMLEAILEQRGATTAVESARPQLEAYRSGRPWRESAPAN